MNWEYEMTPRQKYIRDKMMLDNTTIMGYYAKVTFGGPTFHYNVFVNKRDVIEAGQHLISITRLMPRVSIRRRLR